MSYLKKVRFLYFFIVATICINARESIGLADSSTVEIVIENDTAKISDTSLFTNDNLDSSSDTLPLLEKEPTLLKFIEAKYPAELEKSGIEGAVLVDLLINEKGLVDSVWIIKGLHPSLDTSIMEACKKFIFEPAIAEGDSVAVILRYEYRVSLKELSPQDTFREYVNFKGRIVEKGTRNPVSGVEIILSFEESCIDSTLKISLSDYLKKIGEFEGQRVEGLTIITSTDSNGYFQFKSLPLCKVKVSLIGIGYEPFNSYVELSKNEVAEVTYRIQKSDYSEYEIVVYGKSENVEVAKRTLTVTEIRKMPGFSGDAVKVVQALPGVARSSFGGGSIHVRGTPTWDSKFYLDGIPIPQLYHFGGVKSTYNSDA
ncbi:MAG: TonB family protein, partial [Chitinispirillaceae bacterium]|nr:TonB family protein [Chitinispirillaceae bacterium]